MWGWPIKEICGKVNSKGKGSFLIMQKAVDGTMSCGSLAWPSHDPPLSVTPFWHNSDNIHLPCHFPPPRSFFRWGKDVESPHEPPSHKIHNQKTVFLLRGTAVNWQVKNAAGWSMSTCQVVLSIFEGGRVFVNCPSFMDLRNICIVRGSCKFPSMQWLMGILTMMSGWSGCSVMNAHV